MNFSEILVLIKKGKKAFRQGWNGKNQFVLMVPGTAAPAIPELANVVDGHGDVRVGPYFVIWTGTTINTWVPSVSDLFAEDWDVISSRITLAVDEPYVTTGCCPAEVYEKYAGSEQFCDKYGAKLDYKFSNWQIIYEDLSQDEIESIKRSIIDLCSKIIDDKKEMWFKNYNSAVDVNLLILAIKAGREPESKKAYHLWTEVYNVIKVEYPILMDVWCHEFCAPNKFHQKGGN
jgi:hypothetical protein